MSLHTSAPPHPPLPTPTFLVLQHSHTSLLHWLHLHPHPPAPLLCPSLFSHFSSTPPSPTPTIPLQGADQFTVFLGGVRTPQPPHPSTHRHPQPCNWLPGTVPLTPLASRIIHPWIVFQTWGTSSRGDELLFCSSMSPFVLLSSLRPSSSSRNHKSVCDTINTPEIIAAATNAAERGMKDGGGACDGVMSSQSICGVNSDRRAFQSRSGAGDLVAGGTM